MRHSALVLLFFLFLTLDSDGQKVGVVLSGGGTRAAAHIGFLKALEENGIPIDYIAGTSMGAIIGAMYASGYTIDEIEALVGSQEYIRMAKGEVAQDLGYYFKDYDVDASLGTLRLSPQNFISSTLPTNLVNSSLFDLGLMEGFGPAAAAAGYDFDQLYVPFRCVAADVARKEAVVFRGGDLASAVRASMTYPFYVAPIKVDDRLLFDGGLYNNFPSDVLYDDFLPDVIIGSNVSSNTPDPNEEDLFSQIRSMVVYETNFESLCEHMYIVEHDLEVGVFDFESIDVARLAGYSMAVKDMPQIAEMISRRISAEERDGQRNAFRQKWKRLLFDEITISGLDKSQKNYVRKFVGRKQDVLEMERLRKQYYRIYSDDKIKTIYPKATYNPESGFYKLDLNVKREKDILLGVGGNFSSRPVNMGFINLRYNLFGDASSTLNLNSYFGKFYGSAHASLRIDFPWAVQLSVEPFVTLNRWDYFRSFATFFEEVRPSYIVINEQFAGARFRIPVGNRGRFEVIGNTVQITDDYYRNNVFMATDTADRTRMNALIGDVIYERSTLNRKLYANQGTYLRIQGKGVTGNEVTMPGSTSLNRDTIEASRDWVMLKLQYVNYFSRLGPFKTGVLLEGVLSNQPFFQNTRSSLIGAQSFQPIPESRTFFMPQFRAHNYAAGGLMLVTRFTPSIDLRFEGYGFLANGRIQEGNDGLPTYNLTLRPVYMGSAVLVLHSPVGPVSVSMNYYELKEKPWSFIFNFGYLIFNRSVRHD
ncbi:MAG: patatin-like phospholipase family protein [Flavobacteriales bacterium]